MSKKKGSFVDVIALLQEKRNRQEYDDFETSCLYHCELEDVIRFLEAAEHTDIKDCLRFLERINEDGEMRDEQGLLLFPLAQIRNLLRKSLPEPEGRE